jgi:hypothetical protein
VLDLGVGGGHTAGASLKIAGHYSFTRVRDWPHARCQMPRSGRARAVCSTRSFGGLAIYLSTPRTFAPQVGLEVVDLVGGRYPDVQALCLTPWHRKPLQAWFCVADDAHPVVDAVVDRNGWRGAHGGRPVTAAVLGGCRCVCD